MLAAAIPAGSAAAPLPLLKVPAESVAPGSGAGEFRSPRGIDVNATTGHFYVADLNSRISEFTSWGVFVKAWGWDVAPDGAAGDTAADQFEICTVVCKGGTEGGGAGQFAGPTGVTVDGAGAIYVFELTNRRVQKFSPTGAFELMIGGNVNRTKVEAGGTEAEKNLCTAASGDVCQQGTAGTGNGQFSNPNPSGYIAAGPGNRIYVGDQGRIQRFNSSGQPESPFKFEGPLAAFAGTSVKGLDLDSSGNLYVAFRSIDGIHKLNPAGEPVGPAFAVERPTEVAVDSVGNVYAVMTDLTFPGSIEGARVVGFDPSGNVMIPPSEGFASTEFPGEESADLIGIGTSPRCPGAIGGGICVPTGIDCSTGSDDVYVSRNENGSITPPPRSYLNAYGPPPCFEAPPAVPPTIKAQYAASVDADAAELRAQINPRFWNDATYYVEYGSGECSAGGCTATEPAPPGSLLTAEVVNANITTAGIELDGLQPETTYHYRFVAQSGGGGPVRGVGGNLGGDGAEGTFTTPPPPLAAKVDCPNQAFRTGPGAHLPDCRAYELVSPVDKDNGDIFAFETQTEHPTSLVQSATSGDRLTYSSYRALGDAQSAPYTSQYLAERDPASGWSSHGLSPRRESGSFYGDGGGRAATREFKAFSADLCTGLLSRDSNPPLSAGAPAGFGNLYKRSNCGPLGYEALVRSAPLSGEDEVFLPELQGFAADGSCAVFRANDALTVAGVPASGAKNSNGEPINQVYSACGAQLRLVSVLPSGAPNGTGSSVGTINTLNDASWTTSLEHAVSSDGSRVYWTDEEGIGGGHIYLRVNAGQAQSAIGGSGCSEAAKACTLGVSTTVSGAAAQFWLASANGSAALFTIGEDLYEFDLGSGASTLVAHKAKGVAAASSDLSRIYLVSTEALSGGQENSEGDQAVAGKPNLYLESGGDFVFIATLSGADATAKTQGRAISSPVNIEPFKHSARTTPAGGTLAFMSTASLTGYDNADVNSGADDAEVFVFDAALGELDCVSCQASGARPAGRNFSFGKTPFWIASQLAPYESSLYGPRVLSDDGSHLFFESFDRLVPRDKNGKQDVYQWQRVASRAECEGGIGGELFVQDSGACIALISSGQGSSDSQFLDASPSGNDVFIGTGEGLLPQDRDSIDVYDARIGGGFPPPPAPPSCEGDGCQGPTSAPNDGTPSSQNFVGPGNLPPKKHHKKKHHKKRAQAKKHKTKKHQKRKKQAAKHRGHDQRRAQR